MAYSLTRPCVPRAPAASLLLLTLLLGASAPASASAMEQCLSKQHLNMIVNVRLALSGKTTVMDSCVSPTQQTCVQECCSKELVPGTRCNMAVYQLNKPPGSDNCYLFHCQREDDCPLVEMSGVNSYYILKGLDEYNPSNITTLLPVTTTLTEATATVKTPAHNQSLVPPLKRGVDPQGVLKTSLAAAVVVGLVFLSLAVALLGRKALESFNRRHYTRLELNDLQYDV
ncbi:hypothetical protein MATL_G00259650 [Megalops atlanticus]|uniref:MANSC domain-containing protein n=1 Tax=Megalops atlanticus TaxID=7932 RepID=A0A9D3P8S6_MEGAT|nr:hypothetical protein MATL_G00259650 [Megalops atlanticus]